MLTSCLMTRSSSSHLWEIVFAFLQNTANKRLYKTEQAHDLPKKHIRILNFVQVSEIYGTQTSRCQLQLGNHITCRREWRWERQNWDSNQMAELASHRSGFVPVKNCFTCKSESIITIISDPTFQNYSST